MPSKQPRPPQKQIRRYQYTGNRHGILLRPKHYAPFEPKARLLLGLWSTTAPVKAAEAIIRQWLKACTLYAERLALDETRAKPPAAEVGVKLVEDGVEPYDILVQLLAAFVYLREHKLANDVPNELSRTMVRGFLLTVPRFSTAGRRRDWTGTDVRRFAVHIVERQGLLAFFLNVEAHAEKLEANLEVYRQQVSESLPIEVNQFLQLLKGRN